MNFVGKILFMLKEKKYGGIELWVWLVIITILFLGYVLTKKSKTPKNSEPFAENNKPIIKVYNFNTSWCGWSKKFQPEWDAFVDMVNKDSSMAHVKPFDVKCDVDTNKTMCESVRGFPTVVIDIGNERAEYQSERTAQHLFDYIKSL